VKSLNEYIAESEAWINTPAVGDDFAINVQEDYLLETYILEQDDDGITVYADQAMFDIMEGYGLFDELTLTEQDIDEAEYQGRKVPLGKPMQGDVAKFKVYVKDPKTGNVKKVNFGDKTMRIKKSNPARRKSFRARHRCANPGPRTKARYWSCRKW
jgi:hypothetical protein